MLVRGVSLAAYCAGSFVQLVPASKPLHIAGPKAEEKLREAGSHGSGPKDSV